MAINVLPQNLNPETLLTSHQVGALLQVNSSSINKWVGEGRLKAFRTPGGHRRIRVSDILTFLDTYKMPMPRQLAGMGRIRIIVMDEDPKELAAFKRLLLKSYAGQVEVETATNVVDGLLKVGSFMPRFVFMNANMSEIGGVEACRRLKASPNTKDIGVIVLLGAQDAALAKKAVAAGATACLAKPVAVEALADLLELEPSSKA